jgi:PHD/YefM family antitoxin component YafN of YafNO toxin-antitoxin module
MALHQIAPSYSVRDLQRHYRDVIDTAKRLKEAVVLINNSRPEAVVIDAQTYNELIASLYPYDETLVTNAIARSKASLKGKKPTRLSSWDDLDA